MKYPLISFHQQIVTKNSFHTSNDKYYANINERLSNVQQNCSIYMLENYSFDTW